MKKQIIIIGFIILLSIILSGCTEDSNNSNKSDNGNYNLIGYWRNEDNPDYYFELLENEECTHMFGLNLSQNWFEGVSGEFLQWNSTNEELSFHLRYYNSDHGHFENMYTKKLLN